MNHVKITKEIVEKSPGPNKAVSRSLSYKGNGLQLVDVRSITSESDYTNETYHRISQDNGKTWSDWRDIHKTGYITKGSDEIMIGTGGKQVYNPVYDHFVSISMQRIFDGGHENAYRLFWSQAKRGFHDHCFLFVSKDSENWSKGQLIQYEEGADYDEENWNDPAYLWNNDAYIGTNIQVLDNGDLLFSIGANVESCCKLLDKDIKEIFPSCPQIMKGLIVVRGLWNKQKDCYDLQCSKPVVISDLKSSRGVDEPIVQQLDSGRIIAVFRGSNVQSKNWNTRIEKGTPSHKWYTYSDDGGITFTDPVPWHFDNGEVFYSSATISDFFKSTKNGKLYWIGNITIPEVSGNSPRYPLYIVEVDSKQGLLIKGTEVIIDDRDPEKDSVKLQLSNFTLLENKETMNLEIYLTRLGENDSDFWKSDAYKYTIEFI
ncbi:MAG TPA: hypothetical protein DDZ89_01345 [Clostridiales bacterium]|nr:hypothetical protein [Clostridiales bacterium]